MSINRITYFSDIYHINCYIYNTLSCYFYFNDYIEVQKFLDQLEQDQIYVVTFYLTFNFDGVLHVNCFNIETEANFDNTPNILLSKPILVMSKSDPHLISKFICSRIRLAIDNILIEREEGLENLKVFVNYSKLYM